MSTRSNAASSSNMNSASARASSVLPTPVGPRKMNDPIGRFGSPIPLRERRIASATAATASSWLIRRRCSAASIPSSRSASSSNIRATGTPVMLETTSATSSASTVSVRSCSASHFLRADSSCASFCSTSDFRFAASS